MFSLFLQGRDLSIAYILVALSYMTVGIVFYAAFPVEKSCISQVIIDFNQENLRYIYAVSHYVLCKHPGPVVQSPITTNPGLTLDA